MLPLDEIAGMNYFNFENSSMIQESWSVMPSTMQTLGGNITGLQNCPMLPSLHEMNPQQSSSVSNNSTSDEAEQQQYNIIDERKQRRMISNRESARRSRMRKQKHLDELWSQVLHLRTENHALLDKFNHVFENHNNVVQENVMLKDEVSQLRKLVTNLQINSPISGIPSNKNNVRASSSNQSICSSIDLLD